MKINTIEMSRFGLLLVSLIIIIEATSVCSHVIKTSGAAKSVDASKEIEPEDNEMVNLEYTLKLKKAQLNFFC
jgi:hypothetical protein